MSVSTDLLRLNAFTAIAWSAAWLLCAMCMPTLAEAEVYRCMVDGTATFSDTPCRGAVDVTPAPSAPSRAGKSVNPQGEANLGHVVVGQTQLQVEQAWGPAKSKSIDTNASGHTELWLYDRPQGAASVRFSDGLVSGLNEQQGSGAEAVSASTTATPQTPPSQAEMDSRERAAKAGERKFVHENTPVAEVLQRIGAPDSKSLTDSGECWYYAPAALDLQTSTILCFDLSGYLFQVDRRITR